MTDDLIERWKAEVYFDLSEQRNPGTDEFAKGFNGGIIKARDTIYGKLPSLLKALQARVVQLELQHRRTAGMLIEAAGGEIRVPLRVMERLPYLVLERHYEPSTQEDVFRTRSAALTNQGEGSK